MTSREVLVMWRLAFPEKKEVTLFTTSRAERREAMSRFMCSHEDRSGLFASARTDMFGVLARSGKVNLTRFPVDSVTLSQVLAVLTSELGVVASDKVLQGAHASLYGMVTSRLAVYHYRDQRITLRLKNREEANGCLIRLICSDSELWGLGRDGEMAVLQLVSWLGHGHCDLSRCREHFGEVSDDDWSKAVNCVLGALGI